jgi:WD40 repeat protein
MIIYDAATGDELMRFDTGKGYSQGSSWTSAGDRVVTQNADMQIKIWDALTGELQIVLPEHHHQYLFWVDWSPDGKRLATAGFSDEGPIIWKTHTGEQLFIFDGHLDSGYFVAWSPDGTQIVSTGNNGKALVWDSETGEILQVLQPEGYSFWVAGAEWSHDGSRIVVFDGGKFGHIFDAKTGEELVQICCQDSAWGITWSPSDERIFTVAGDGTGKVWDAETGVELIVYDVGGFPFGAYSPDGSKVLLATGDGTTKIFPTWHSPQELIDHANECCVVRELTLDERDQFGLPEKP